jgi:hypothetical protein
MSGGGQGNGDAPPTPAAEVGNIADEIRNEEITPERAEEISDRLKEIADELREEDGGDGGGNDDPFNH